MFIHGHMCEVNVCLRRLSITNFPEMSAVLPGNMTNHPNVIIFLFRLNVPAYTRMQPSDAPILEKYSLKTH